MILWQALMGIDWKKLGDEPGNLTLEDFEKLAEQLDEQDYYAIQQLFDAVSQIADLQDGKFTKVRKKHRKPDNKEKK